MLFAIHMIDRPGAAEIRASVRDEHLAFVAAHRDKILIGGPLVTDDGQTAAGSLVVMDLPDRDAALALLADEPNVNAGVYESITIRAFQQLIGPAGAEGPVAHG